MNKSGSNLDQQKGFTLIEVLISSAIFVMVLSTVMLVFSLSGNLQSKNKAVKEASINARYAVEAISRQVRLAQEFTIRDSGDRVSIITIIDNQKIKKEYFFDQNSATIQLSDGVKNYNLTDPSLIKVQRLNNQPFFSGLDSRGTTDFQPYLNIQFAIESNLGKRKTDKFVQTIATRAAARTYAGFNQTIPIELNK